MAYPCGERCVNDVIIRLSSTQFRILAVVIVIGSMIGLSHLIATVWLSTCSHSSFAYCTRMAEVTPITKLPAPQVTPFSMAFVTISNQDEAQKLAKKIVQTKLAACVNIVPKIISVYEWKGNVENDSESLMMIKTRSSRVEELIEFVRKHHPYEVCEVISTPIQQGNPAYLEWLGNYVGDKDKEETCG